MPEGAGWVACVFPAYREETEHFTTWRQKKKYTVFSNQLVSTKTTPKHRSYADMTSSRCDICLMEQLWTPTEGPWSPWVDHNSRETGRLQTRLDRHKWNDPHCQKAHTPNLLVLSVCFLSFQHILEKIYLQRWRFALAHSVRDSRPYLVSLLWRLFAKLFTSYLVYVRK